MKSILATAVGALLIVGAPADALQQPAPATQTEAAKPTPVDPAPLALAHQILAIGIPAAKRAQMFTSIMDSIADQARKSTENLGLTKDKDFQALMI